MTNRVKYKGRCDNKKKVSRGKHPLTKGLLLRKSRAIWLTKTVDTCVIPLVSLLSQPQSKIDAPSTSSTVWLTKAVDISVSYPVHVVVYTVPSLRRPPVLLVRQRVIRGGKLQFTLSHRTNYRALRSTGT